MHVPYLGGKLKVKHPEIYGANRPVFHLVMVLPFYIFLGFLLMKCLPHLKDLLFVITGKSTTHIFSLFKSFSVYSFPDLVHSP